MTLKHWLFGKERGFIDKDNCLHKMDEMTTE